MNFTYSHNEIVWILHHYQELRAGVWPDPINELIGLKTKVISARANFENPCLLCGEVGSRIKLCGFDGMLTEERYGIRDGKSLMEWEIANQRRIPVREICQRIKKAIAYICSEGTNGARRLESYDTWKRQNKNRRQLRTDNTVAKSIDKTHVMAAY